MKNRAFTWALTALCSLFVAWNVRLLAQNVDISNLNSFGDREFTGDEIASLVLMCGLLLSFTILNEIRVYSRTRSISRGMFLTRIAWVLGLVSSTTQSQSISPNNPTILSAPVAGALSPIAAISVLKEIERRRREQIRVRIKPDFLTDEESIELQELRATAVMQSSGIVPSNTAYNDNYCPLLMRGVDRVASIRSNDVSHQTATQWAVEVKVFGYPMVISSHGEIAEFRKKRALELLTWLALNRDRARRSAARTALWEFDVTDSSFSTVVSDMRRALRDISKGFNSEDWVPTTYSDELPLSSLVVTDADRLQLAYDTFLKSGGCDSSELMILLKGVRDVPFAGTNYVWADLDGSTTRLVISAVNICTEVAELARSQENGELLHSAVSAGLRVLPGCEELLDIQDRYLAKSFTRRMK
jgi:hypothetical protein